MTPKLFAAICCVLAASIHPASAQGVKEPGGTADDVMLSVTNPDEYAWRLFFFLNRPAKAGTAGVADEGAKFGDTSNSRSMVWETWALASGNDQSEVYKLDGSKPAEWAKLDRQDRKFILDKNRERLAVTQDSRQAAPAGAAAFFPETPDEQEVRMNQSTFEFIRENEMYNIDGLEALLTKARSANDRFVVQFRPEAKEIKAQWLEIPPTEKVRYFWRDVVSGNTTKTYGLVSIHIITKDLPNWFWSDFGHVDCEKRLVACNINGQEPALTKPVDTSTRMPSDTETQQSQAPHGKGGVRDETRGTVWANYILRGTQTAFVTAVGEPTMLSNPVIENGFQKSSCLTCHARAGVGPRLTDATGKPVSGINRLSTGDPSVGIPNPAVFGDSTLFRRKEIQFLQTDFLWSPVFRASRKTQ